MDEPEEIKRASENYAAQLRRVMSRLVVADVPVAALDRAAAQAAQFADEIDALPERDRGWNVPEGELVPANYVMFNPVVGPRNPVAPPVKVWKVDDDDGGFHVEGTVTFSWAYEGPPAHAHGGLVAAMYDDLLGNALRLAGMTAYLHVNYKRPTPLNRELTLHAYCAELEGRKCLIRATCTLDGEVLSEGEALFVAPRSGERFGVAPPK